MSNQTLLPFMEKTTPKVRNIKPYRERNKERIKLTEKAYRERNKEKLKVASEAYRKISNVKYWNRNLFKCFKSKNNKLNTKIDFDADYLLELFEKQNGLCPYFKIPLIPSPDKSPFQPSVDRKDNYIGYTKDNIVLCSYMANMSRNDIPYDKWMEFLNKLQINYITEQTNYSEQ
jgi:hypothetical protein